MKKLIIIQTVTPDYRKSFFEELYSKLGNNFELYSGDFYFEPTVVSCENIKRIRIKNLFFFKRKLLFQIGIWHLLLKKDVLVLGLNPRVISSWLFLIIRSVLRKETYLWGHAWGRKGIGNKTDWLRGFMRKLANGVIVYTNKQKQELQEKMPNKKIYSAPNSLYDKSKMEVVGSDEKKINIISVGRLVSSKKNLFLARAFKQGIARFPANTKLIIVGDGDNRLEIEKFVNNNKLKDRILLLGHIGDYITLKKLYSEAYFSVSAGYVGLSVTQSFSFGVPMLVSKNENHSPEIEAVISNENAIFFNTDDENDFILKLENAFNKKIYWNNKRKNIIEFCKNNYSTESMANVFINLV